MPAMPTHERSKYGLLILLLVLGLAVRLVFLHQTSEIGLETVDERHYHQLGSNILSGWGLAWGPGEPTSIRPPLYPAFLALVWALVGTESLIAVRGVQIVLSLFNVLFLYQLGLRVFSHRVALLAAAVFCFYPTLLAFNYLLLTEVLFTFLLTLFVFGYVVLVQTGKISIAVGTGCVLGLAALTRSILWPFPILLCPLAFIMLPGSRLGRLRLVGCLFLGYLVIVGPWAVRNTALQGEFTVVNTMGGITLLMGNYEHTPLNRAWDPITLRGERSIFKELRQQHPESSTWTEGQKEKWAQHRALENMRKQPLLTIKRSLVKFANFWGLERVIVAGIQQGYYQPPRWFTGLATFLISFAYMGVMLLACLGIFRAAPKDQRVHAFFIILILFISGLHSLTFGHSRYHLPLLPLLILYGASAFAQRSWLSLREGLPVAAAPVAAWTLLLAIWGREILVVETDRIKNLVHSFLS